MLVLRGHEPEMTFTMFVSSRFLLSQLVLFSFFSSRKSLHSMTVTSWRRGALCSPCCHLGPLPRRSPTPSQCLRTWSWRICPRIDPPCHVSLSLRVHRADRGCHRGPNPRRSLEWDFDSLMRVSLTHRDNISVGVANVLVAALGKSKQSAGPCGF